MEDLGCNKSDEEKINVNESCKCNIEDAVTKEDDREAVESTKSEMAGVREENVRLKSMLKQIENDYKALKMRFMDAFQQDSNKSKKIESAILNISAAEDEELSLRLGTSPSIERAKNKEDISVKELGLNCNFFEGLKSNYDDGDGSIYNKCNKKEDDQKVLKTQRSGDDELVSQTSHVKRARVCVRARCDTPTMNDGCQWRKYGQKIAKGNPCPRAYYRCTVSPTCPVRKQVQRCMEDMAILITTYEGTHNHPLPISATAMASTTSAAASMLLSGSSTTSPLPPPLNLYGPPPPTPTFRPYDNSRITTQPNYFLPPYNSPSTTFPTITLDLTTNPSATHGGFGLHNYSSTNTSRTNNIPRLFSPTSLSFSSMDSNIVPTGIFPYGTFPYKNNAHHLYHSLLPEKTTQEQEYRSYLEKFNQGSSSQQALTETLTKVITSDASFRSVIEAAISTMAANNGGGRESAGGTTSKWGDQHIPAATDSNHLT